MDIIEQIYEAISEIDEIKGIFIEKDELLSDSINSLSFIILLMKIEQRFGIEIDEDDLNYNTFKTLEDIKKYVAKRI